MSLVSENKPWAVPSSYFALTCIFHRSVFFTCVGTYGALDSVFAVLEQVIGVQFSAAHHLRPAVPLPDMGSEPDFCHRDGQPLLTWLSAIQRMECGLEDRRTRPVARKVEPDAARISGDDCREFQQLISQGIDLRIRQGRVFERQCA